MQEYFGRYTNILDAKGRINLPARFRDITLKDESGELIFIMTRGTEENIAVFPINEWRRKINELETTVTDGKQRRILIRRINYYASNPDALYRMASKARSFGRPDAAKIIVDDCYQLIRPNLS